MTKSMNDMLEWFMLRVSIYDFLRCIFLFGPKTEILASLYKTQKNPYTQKLSEYDMAKISILEEEHTRIFINPATMSAVPYASHYLSSTGLLMGDVTFSLRKRYIELGYVLDDRTFSEDHVGVELELIYLLAAKTINALNEGDNSKLKELVKNQRDFIKDHMLRWIPAFCSAIKNNTSEDSFYYNLATLLESFLKDDAARLDLFLTKTRTITSL